MATLTSRLVISLVDRASGPARGIAGSLRALHQSARSSPIATIGAEAKKTGQHMTAFAGKTAAAGYALYSFMNATKEFNESKFGTGFAKITDHIKNGKFDTKAWAEEMNAAADSARKLAKEFGTTPTAAMKAMEAVQKLGFKDKEGDSVWRSALGLHLSEPDGLASDQAAAFVGAMYRAYEKQRDVMAAKLGKDAHDDGFQNAWIKGIAGKAAVAAAESALSPGDLVEGLRQYAPQWAQFGISPEFAMAALAHGSNYGFRAPELGTAYKSMANRLIKPTAEGNRWLNNLGIDKSKYMSSGPQDPERALTQLNSLVGGGLSGKNKGEIRKLLTQAVKDGTTATPEFQQKLSNRVAKMLGRKTGADLDDIEMSVANSTLASGGQIDLDGIIRKIISSKAGPAALMSIFEGKHYARGTPMFEFYDKFYKLYEKLLGVDGSVMDAVVEGRKKSESGTADQLYGAWQDFLIQMQDSGVIEGVKAGLTSIADMFKYLGKDGSKLVMQAIVLGSALSIAASGVGIVVGALRTLYAVGVGFATLAAGGGAAGAAAAGGRALFGMGAGVAGGAAAAKASGRMITGMGAGAQASSKMIAGMGAAGGAAGGLTAKAVGRGLVARLIPGVGWALVAAGVGTGGYSAYKDYQKNGDLGSAAWAFGKGFLTLGTGDAEAAEGPGAGAGAPGSAESDIAGIGSKAGAITSSVQSAMAQVRAIVAAVDLTGEGQRIMQSLANGISAGAPAAAAAASAAGGQVQSAIRGAYSDAGR